MTRGSAPLFAARSERPQAHTPYLARHRRADGGPTSLDALDLDTGNLAVTLHLPSSEQGQLPQIALPTRQRRASTARPIGHRDRVLVEQSTRVLRALELVEPGLPATVERSRRREVLVITPPKLPAVHVTAAPPRAPRRLKPRGWRLAAGLWLVSMLVVAGSVFAIATAVGQRVAPRRFAPSAASLDAIPPNAQLVDDWATSSGVSRLDIGGGAGPGAAAPGSAGLPVKPAAPNPTPPKSTPPSTSGVQPAPLHPWPPTNAYMFVPGHPAFAVGGSGGFYSWTFGQCTWWAQNKRRDENLMHMGNAQYWANSAAGRGYKVGSAPAANATVVFQPGVQGAGGAGHVAHVEAVYPGGWFLISEMNFYWNGGGLARVDYRFAHSGPGVSFIY